MLRPPFSQEPISINKWDVIVIGAGAAGLMTCLELPENLNVLLLNRNTSKRSSSRWAQGGIASVVRPEDSFALHVEDTLKAGDGLCDVAAVEMLVREAPSCVDRLQNLGMIFDTSSDQLATTLEAAHSCRRVLHVKDRTGRALVEVLEDQIESKKNILHCRGVRVTELLIESEECRGVQVLDGSNLYWITSKAVVLATGGGGHLFTNTTNPAQSSGEGIALSWKAGAVIEDLEFIQFHPTALKFYGSPCFLISEALRGEGAVLIDKNGESPVKHLQNRDLSTRDQVSRAIMNNMNKNHVDHVGLDLRFIDPEKIVRRFPTILSRCQDYGINPLNEVIPVAPAAHYWMGGVFTNLNASTTKRGLYAVGEVASTGVHGANRLASNSLMECLVFARKMSSIELNSPLNLTRLNRYPKEVYIDIPHEDYISSISEKIDVLRNSCWSNLGVSRNKKSMIQLLITLQDEIDQLQKNPLLMSLEKIEIDQKSKLSEPNRRGLNLLLDLNNRQITTMLLLKACLFREESRGGHYRDDFPTKDINWECHTRQQLNQKICKRFVKN
ncbi:L-aspartate oxidase [Prochlorococcus sp. AH-716-K03]|nr:L-aspartate oxidase [Prochlorococcus sp. AH-716-K03]